MKLYVADLHFIIRLELGSRNQNKFETKGKRNENFNDFGISTELLRTYLLQKKILMTSSVVKFYPLSSDIKNICRSSFKSFI